MTSSASKLVLQLLTLAPNQENVTSDRKLKGRSNVDTIDATTHLRPSVGEQDKAAARRIIGSLTGAPPQTIFSGNGMVALSLRFTMAYPAFCCKAKTTQPPSKAPMNRAPCAPIGRGILCGRPLRKQKKWPRRTMLRCKKHVRR